MLNQIEIFKLIDSRFTVRGDFLRAVADTLSISLPNVRRRVNGKTTLIYDEMRKLIKEFDISEEELFPNRIDQLSFNYRKLDLAYIENYEIYLKDLQTKWEKAAENKSTKITIVTDEIPIFYLMAYPQLTLFKLYCYSYDMGVYKSSFESFIANFEKHDVAKYFKRIRTAYGQVDSLEIWDEEVLSTILNDFKSKKDLDCFDDQATLENLKEDIKELINKFRLTVVAGNKEEGGKLEFFRSESINRLSYMLVEENDSSRLAIKLYRVNTTSTKNPNLIEESKKWVNVATNNSLSLRVGSERKRKIFFDSLITKIDT